EARNPARSLVPNIEQQPRLESSKRQQAAPRSERLRRQLPILKRRGRSAQSAPAAPRSLCKSRAVAPEVDSLNLSFLQTRPCYRHPGRKVLAGLRGRSLQLFQKSGKDRIHLEGRRMGRPDEGVIALRRERQQELTWFGRRTSR